MHCPSSSGRRSPSSMPTTKRRKSWPRCIRSAQGQADAAAQAQAREAAQIRPPPPQSPARTKPRRQRSWRRTRRRAPRPPWRSRRPRRIRSPRRRQGCECQRRRERRQAYCDTGGDAMNDRYPVERLPNGLTRVLDRASKLSACYRAGWLLRARRSARSHAGGVTFAR